MVKGIIFDLDGTSLNTDIYVVLNYINLFEKFCPERLISLKELAYLSGPSLTWGLDTYFYGLDREKIMEEYLSWAEENAVRYTLMYPREREAFEYFKKENLKIGLVTNKIKSGVERCLTAFDLKKYFNSVFYYERTSKHKPDPEPILCCIKELGLSKDEAIYVGDDKVDIQAGKAAGVKVCLVKFGLKEVSNEDDSDYKVTSYDELSELVSRLIKE